MVEVITMKYDNLYAVLDNEPDAKAYFDKLPGYVREELVIHASKVDSFESMQDYAQNLT